MQKFPQYTTGQKVNHWLTALLVFFVISLLILKLTLLSWFGEMANIYMLHKTVGILILFLTFYRIYTIKKAGVPIVIPVNQKLLRILAKSVQGFIYLLLIILPVSGYLMSSRPLNFGNLVTIPAIQLPNAGYVFFHKLHIYGSYWLIALLLCHIIAALYHYFWIKDNVLKSMI